MAGSNQLNLNESRVSKCYLSLLLVLPSMEKRKKKKLFFWNRAFYVVGLGLKLLPLTSIARVLVNHEETQALLLDWII